MSASTELQKAVYDRLVASVGVLAGIHDRPSPDAGFPYATFGPSLSVKETMDCISARTEVLQIDIWSQSGKLACKEVVDAVVEALHNQQLSLPTHSATPIEVTRFQVVDDPDGITRHGIVTIETMVEEN